jgi:hypothetical protein
MKRVQLVGNLVAGALLALAATSVAHAQATRTWVSGVGDDANPCSRTAPCKTFAGAISKTAAGGEIDCLDPGGFGVVTITKGITIDCDSGAGGILSSGTQGMIINITSAPAATDLVFIRNLQINGAGTGTNGINIVNGGSKGVVLQDVTVERVTGSGIIAGTNAKVTVIDSVIANTSLGISQTGSGSQVFITKSAIANTGTALQSSAGNFIGASGNSFTNNSVVYNQNGGQIFTGSDNPGFGNGPTGATTGAVSKL